MAAQMGQALVPDNRASSGGIVGLTLAAKSPPDGYTVLVTSPAIAISPVLYASLQYDSVRDFAPVARLASIENVMSKEAGVPGLRMSIWYGMFAPAGTPRDIVMHLYREAEKAFQDPELLKEQIGPGSHFQKSGPGPIWSSPAVSCKNRCLISIALDARRSGGKPATRGIQELWWKPLADKLERAKNLAVCRIPAAAVQALEALADRSMQLQCTVQEGQLYFSNAAETVQIELEALKVGANP